MKRIVAALLGGTLVLSSQSCRAPLINEPGGTEKDEHMALNDSAEYAWRLFFFLNRQAKLGVAGEPDLTKRFGEFDRDAPTVWETWALASGGPESSEVYRKGGVAPGSWGDLDRKAKKPLILDKNFELEMLEESDQVAPLSGSNHRLFRTRRRNLKKSQSGKAFPPLPDDQEVRMNRASFESVIRLGMYNSDGLQKLLTTARQSNDAFLIQVDRHSKEVKAQWKPIDESQKSRYFWREYLGKPYGLVALHIITKDLPNWFWADFGHVDCESGQYACKDFSIPPRNCDSAQNTCPDDSPKDSTTRGLNGKPGPHGVNGVRKETEGTVWANYILRGTQTSFTYSTGEPTTLTNPVIEDGKHSSCITCHARATVGTPVLLPNLIYFGTPDPKWYRNTPQSGLSLLQTDFMWSPIIETQQEEKSRVNGSKTPQAARRVPSR